MTEATGHEAVMGSDGVVVVSDVDPDIVEAAVGDPSGPFSGWLPAGIQKAIASWAEDQQGGGRSTRPSGIMQRDRYVTPGKVYEQMALAYDSADDDIVGQFLDTSEAVAFQKVGFDSADEDEHDIWNQIGKDLDLDSFVRQAWRELGLVSQYYGVRNFANKTYRVRGEADGGRPRRKEFNLVAPTGLGFLDPTRVVPVALDPFGNYRLAWIASKGDMHLYGEVKDGLQDDEVVQDLFLGSYKPTKKEAADFEREDIPADYLLELNPALVWRHTLTKSTFERWPRIRMKSVFPLLDLKNQAREMDRAFLLGGINFIVLVTRGTDTMPAKSSDVMETANMVRAQAKSPIIVSDHRIKIEIITPDQKDVLSPTKWDVIDSRIALRLWGGFDVVSQSGADPLTRARLVARGFSSRRHMMKRDLEKNIVAYTQAINEDFESETKLHFTPRRIELDFDATLMQALSDLRDRGDLSRETLLGEFDFNQATEARRREAEDKKYKKPDDEKSTFSQTNVPFNSPENQATPKSSGGKGGRPRTTPQKKAT